MFRSLRTNQQFFILTKGANPRLDIATVTNVSAPVVKFQPVPMPGSQPEYTVDVTVSLNGAPQSFQKLPADKDIADFGEGFGNIVVADSRDAMNAEVLSLKKSSEDHIARVNEEEQKIVAFDKIIQQLNPEYAEKQKQELKIQNLENQIQQMAQTNANLERMMAKMLERFDNEEKPSKGAKS